MEFFSFIKTIFTSSTAVQKATPLQTIEADMDKISKVVALFKVPQEKRDQNWHTSFYQYVLTASFTSDTEQVFTGPDGFPYFILRTPEPDKPFKSFCIHNLKDYLLDNGLGVVLNPTTHAADWVFTHGDIVNLHLNNEFVTMRDDNDLQNIDFKETVGVIKTTEEVLVGQPSVQYLPKQTRMALKKFLQGKGIKNPMVMLIVSKGTGKMLQKLAFNVHPEDFAAQEKLDHRIRQIGWFLPSHYILVTLLKNDSLTQNFSAL
jgi:hypothetical protein